jgi:hypothetical protein
MNRNSSMRFHLSNLRCNMFIGVSAAVQVVVLLQTAADLPILDLYTIPIALLCTSQISTKARFMILHRLKYQGGGGALFLNTQPKMIFSNFSICSLFNAQLTWFTSLNATSLSRCPACRGGAQGPRGSGARSCASCWVRAQPHLRHLCQKTTTSARSDI